MKLHISDDLKLSIDFVTQTQAILAKRGVGKSYTAAVQAEELLAADQQIVAIDPTGAWYGLKSSANGKSAGYPVVVFGGEHADVPLEEASGEIVATSIVEHRFSAILDLSLLRKGAMQRFMAPFAETLYRLNRTPLHLFVDEADAVAPQKPFGEEARTLGAMEDIVRRGRVRGIGCTLITQRPAVLNKNVLTQCELLTALRLVHPRDIDAVMEWVNVHGEPQLASDMTQSLPSLPIGTAWMWCPAWELFKKVRIRQRKTFDSGATPKAGQKVRPPKVLAAVDVERLGEQIKATVQRAKENDPRELRAQLAAARAAVQKLELEKQKTHGKPSVGVPKIVEKKVITDQQIQRLEKLQGRIEQKMDAWWKRAAEQMNPLLDLLKDRDHQVRQLVAAARSAISTPSPVISAPARKISAPAVSIRSSRPTVIDDGDRQTDIRSHVARPARAEPGAITPRQQRMLDVAATLTTLNAEVSRETICGWLGIHPRGGSVGEELKALTDGGLITNDRGRISITDAGMAAAMPMDPASAIESAKLGLSARQTKFFEIITRAYPQGTTREAIAQEMQIHPRGGSLGEGLGRLVARGLVDRAHGVYRARDFLFAGVS